MPTGQNSRSDARWQAALFVLLACLVYRSILAGLVHDWWTDPDYSHGFFVPIFAAFLVWQRRNLLGSLPLAPSWLGLVGIAGALAMFVVGRLGAEQFLSRSSFLFLLAGMVVYFLGWRQFRALLFPWAFLFLMIPIPHILFYQITLPLQFLACGFASSLLGLLGVPVLRTGNILHLPAMSLEVVEACSGIRSLVSLVTLTLIYGYFFEPKRLLRIALVAAAVPIAVIANGLRVAFTGLLGQYWSPDKVTGFFHTFSGWVVFLFSVWLLIFLHGAMALPARRHGDAES